MSNFSYIKLIGSTIFLLTTNGCSPVIPDNYLSPLSVSTPSKINGKWVEPNIIPISLKMLSSPEGRQLLQPALQPQPYQIGAFDSLSIIVWGHPELSTIATGALPNTTTLSALPTNSGSTNPSVLVQTDGTIFYPYVGHLKVAGLTINEAQKVMTQRLSVYIRNPQITIQIDKYNHRNVYVLGEVKTPGMEAITDKPLTLLEAISAAGGINTGSADPSHIYLIRGSFQEPQIFWLNAQTPQALMIAEQFPLKENDIIYVSAAMFNSWNNAINTILPTFSNYWAIKGAVTR